MSYQHLLILEAHLRHEVDELFALSEHANQAELPEGFSIRDEVAIRQARLARLAEAKAVLEARAAERDVQEAAAYAAKLQEREERARRKGRKPRGRPPRPPTPGPRAKDQYNFTDPESRIMKHRRTEGFEQDDHAQLAVDQQSLLIVGESLSNHPTDQHEIEPTLDAIAPEVGTPEAAALDAGYFSEENIALLERRGIGPYIATGRDPHHPSWQERFASLGPPPAEDASPKVKMAYKLKTMIGAAIYRVRKATVEPVIGIIKEAMGFRQFSLRGEQAAGGEWCLLCLAFNLRRLHTLLPS